MSKEAFTPGPWRVEYETTLVWGNCDQEDTSSCGMGYPIAEARITPSGYWAKKPDCFEGEANAHLIAAAPELYEAVLKALSYIENTERLWGITLSSGDELRAVLAKARGEA